MSSGFGKLNAGPMSAKRAEQLTADADAAPADDAPPARGFEAILARKNCGPADLLLQIWAAGEVKDSGCEIAIAAEPRSWRSVDRLAKRAVTWIAVGAMAQALADMKMLSQDLGIDPSDCHAGSRRVEDVSASDAPDEVLRAIGAIASRIANETRGLVRAARDAQNACDEAHALVGSIHDRCAGALVGAGIHVASDGCDPVEVLIDAFNTADSRSTRLQRGVKHLVRAAGSFVRWKRH